MPKLKDHIENALNEARILVLVVEVMLAFEFQSFFQKGFEKLPDTAQHTKALGLGLMMVSAVFLMAPAAYHHIVEQGKITERFHGFITDTIAIALLPFTTALGLDVYAVTQKVIGSTMGITAGIITFAIALFFLYGLGLMHRKEEMAGTPGEGIEMHDHEGPGQVEDPPLKDKVREVMTELRVVLPGIQAILGFQFAVMFQDGFEKLSKASQVSHLVSLALVAISTIVLMTPAAYHRIAEAGKDTEHFQHFASKMLLWAMGILALGISVDLYVVVLKVFHARIWGIVAALAMLVFFYGVWFGYTFLVRRRQGPAPQTALNFGS